ncbi:glutathione S-transferase 2-like isoform X2 [Panonychus citri]|uniref:glutathione S-transferase 2-like isoform X2 n=1 Tax=Panonychus citri TaxID=50023 RepID=UPI002306E138|nr:glutathione S-transferase 2-like isoform X2 [Panonychus citri]
MSIQLFHNDLSPPSRVVRILIKLLDLKVEETKISLIADEHLRPEFTSINPFHQVPTLIDGDFTLWERAILTYLVDRFAPGNSLYPSDLKARATIDRWLYWDIGTMYATLRPFIANGSIDSEADQLFKDKAKELDDSLAETKYVAGDTLTIADLSLGVTINFSVAIGIDLSGLSHINRWTKQLESDLKSDTWSRLVVQPNNALVWLYHI